MSTSSVVSIASGAHRARVLARRDALVETHLDLVRSIAKSVAHSLPCSFELDDLIATGYLGLIKAATNYRPRAHNGTPFSAYARPVIRGAILDSVRRGKYVEHTRPSADDVAEPWTSPDLEAELDQARSVERIDAAVSRLAPRLQVVVRMHYGEDERLPAVADALEVGKSRASQLHMEAVRMLRAELAV